MTLSITLTRHSRVRTGRSRPGVLAPLMAVLVAGVALGQYQVSGGRALDANLMRGSSGYNASRAGSALVNKRYTIGSTKPLYTVTNTGELAYNPYNAFYPNSFYTATGYRDFYERKDWGQRRFRYGEGYGN
jgi:hypothetical protein